MNKIKFTIDGKEIVAEKGITILEAAKKCGKPESALHGKRGDGGMNSRSELQHTAQQRVPSYIKRYACQRPHQ